MSNKFVTYFRGLDSNQKKELAASCETSVEYLSHRSKTAITASEATHGLILIIIRNY